MKLFVSIDDIKIYYVLENLECYKPLEDSFLLYKWNKKLSRGFVLDIGTGCGIQAICAAKKQEVSEVIAVDIDKTSIELAKYNAKINGVLNKIKFVVSDLFRNIPKCKFDTILFNPPYLPEDRREIGKTKIWTTGGKEGNEIIIRFLREAREFLKDRSIILLIISSLSNKNKIEREIISNSYKFKILDKIKIPFEELYIYKIWKI